jgi:glycosyltransferase involved in cell wall biosynthesis
MVTLHARERPTARAHTVLHLMFQSTKNLWITELVEATDQARYRPVVVSVEGRGQLQSDVQAVGVEAEALDAFDRSAYPLAVWRLARVIARYRPDVLHSHLLYADLIAAPLRRLRAVPRLVFTRHESPGLMRYLDIPSWKRAAVALAARAAYSAADAVIAPSARTLDELVGWRLPATKLVRIPIGLDTAKIDTVSEGAIRDARLQLGLGTGVSAITISKFSPQKNLPFLIRVWRDVCVMHPGAKLVIVGDGAQEGELRALVADLGLERSVLMVGWRDDVYTLLRAVDLMIHVSHTESTGMVLLEALAARKPLVVTPVGVVGEYLRDDEHCVIVPHGDEEATLRAIERVLSDQGLRSRLERNGRQLVEGTFAMRIMASRYADIYDRVLRVSP